MSSRSSSRSSWTTPARAAPSVASRRVITGAMASIDRDLPRARVEALFGVAALIEDAIEDARRDLRAAERELLEDAFEQAIVEIISAELVHARGREHVVQLPAHAHERRVERAAAE